MYSPRRTAVEPNEMSNSPLRAFTPIVDVIKSAQTTASRDFDRFYDNLWAKLTPRTSSSRIRKRSPERESTVEMGTSLTPLIARHSLREDSRFEYTNNPFYKNDDSTTTYSEIAQTPGLLEEEQVPMFASQHSFEDEKKRMDKLQTSISKIKRQSSFLAEESSLLSSLELSVPAKLVFQEEEDDDDDEEQVQQLKGQQQKPKYTSTPVQNNYTPIQKQYAPMTPVSAPRSTNTPRNSNNQHYDDSPAPKRIALSPSRKPTNRNVSSLRTSPKRIIIDTPLNNKLRSTELISTPGGSIVSNRFWKEIHGSSSSSNNNTTHTTTTTPSESNNWANDDSFWSQEETPKQNRLNSKLFQLAQQETVSRQHKDMQWSSSLSQELEDANKKSEEIKKRNCIPTINPDLLAELKARHREKLIDDSDEYKFN